MTIIDSSVHSSLEPRKVVALLILWVVLSAAAAIAVSIASPHGMAAFVITSVVLGLLGGIVHVILYAWLLQTERMKMSYQLALISGLLCGLAAFPVTTTVAEHAVYLPHDTFQYLLVGYLATAGATTGCFVTYLLFFRRAKP